MVQPDGAILVGGSSRVGCDRLPLHSRRSSRIPRSARTDASCSRRSSATHPSRFRATRSSRPHRPQRADEVVVFRLRSDGALDPSFGAGGAPTRDCHGGSAPQLAIDGGSEDRPQRHERPDRRGHRRAPAPRWRGLRPGFRRRSRLRRRRPGGRVPGDRRWARRRDHGLGSDVRGSDTARECSASARTALSTPASERSGVGRGLSRRLGRLPQRLRLAAGRIADRGRHVVHDQPIQRGDRRAHTRPASPTPVSRRRSGDSSRRDSYPGLTAVARC